MRRDDELWQPQLPGKKNLRGASGSEYRHASTRPRSTLGSRHDALIGYPQVHEKERRAAGPPWTITAKRTTAYVATRIAVRIGLLEAAGCTPVSLGPRTLRVETALVAALGRLGAPAGLA